MALYVPDQDILELLNCFPSTLMEDTHKDKAEFAYHLKFFSKFLI